MFVLGDMWTEVKRESHTIEDPNGSFATVEEVTYQRFVAATLEDLQTKKQLLEANLADLNEVIANFEKQKEG